MENCFEICYTADSTMTEGGRMHEKKEKSLDQYYKIGIDLSDCRYHFCRWACEVVREPQPGGWEPKYETDSFRYS